MEVGLGFVSVSGIGRHEMGWQVIRFTSVQLIQDLVSALRTGDPQGVKTPLHGVDASL